MKKLILLLLALSFLFSCDKQKAKCEAEVGGERICIGKVIVGGVYGKESDKFDSLDIFRKTKNIGN